jgi:hypothetical protein
MYTREYESIRSYPLKEKPTGNKATFPTDNAAGFKNEQESMYKTG